MDKKQVRTDFRKNRSSRTRKKDWIDEIVADDDQEMDLDISSSDGAVDGEDSRDSGTTTAFSQKAHGTDQVRNRGIRSRDEASRRTERISGKGEISRRRTVTVSEIIEEDGETRVVPEIDQACTMAGRVLSVHGIYAYLLLEQGVTKNLNKPMEESNATFANGTVWRCTTRRLLWTLSSDQRHAVVVGDRVRFTPMATQMDESQEPEGIIERVEPRYGCLARESRKQKHIVVANVDQVLIVSSAASPEIKPELIDRMILAAEKGGIRPIICINKADLVEIASLMPLVGQYSRMGYPVLVVSAATGLNIGQLRRWMAGRETAVVGQSGVGKSSLLNAMDPTLELSVGTVSEENEKGRHTTTASRLIPLSLGGYMVDTPGIRQFQLWNVIPEEVINYYRDLRAYVNLCRYPDCTHTVEEGCAMKDAVADGRLDERRYESYCHLREDH
ncbi:MAG: ribosome small subunit-dependent GTPase A [Thermoguttaceae bacterium]|nr:ribosome small subunit-dependent GTPase A [Thermoguttaceae bacterium]